MKLDRTRGAVDPVASDAPSAFRGLPFPPPARPALQRGPDGGGHGNRPARAPMGPAWTFRDKIAAESTRAGADGPRAPGGGGERT